MSKPYPIILVRCGCERRELQVETIRGRFKRSETAQLREQLTLNCPWCQSNLARKEAGERADGQLPANTEVINGRRPG